MVMNGTKSMQVREKVIQRITDLLDNWYNDKEIMHKLKIPKTTYYRYKSQIYQEDKQLLAQIRTDELAHLTMKVRKSLEYCIKVNVDICEHSKDPKARSEASRLIVQANMGLRNLAMEPHYDEKVRIISKEVNEDTNKELDE